ncbi:MAG: shikimate dehydrogenase [Proteobacteria bacterium]|jgi:shikimate dehydrogenase|nr:shikimate dehydrogenase [Pseudomonadota bacterium]
MDRYALIGHPVEHSTSPLIHAAFARQTQQELSYQALLAPLDGFSDTVRMFRAEGGRGANITVPFKIEACSLATRLTERARLAGAVNTLTFGDDIIIGDNTDGIGLVRDLIINLGCPLAGRHVLLLGAGGAARGAIFPLFQTKPVSLTIANRSIERAQELRAAFAPHAGQTAFTAGGFEDLGGWEFDVVINATSASLKKEALHLPRNIFAPDAFAYDMMYGASDTPFLAWARAAGVARLSDGLGMLVEQAAESFALWRGVRPNSASVLSNLRRKLASKG